LAFSFEADDSSLDKGSGLINNSSADASRRLLVGLIALLFGG
jgi:hypothetical protein